MFRMICTVLRPEHGATLIDGIDSEADPLGARRRLGVLPDIRALYQRLAENATWLRKHGFGR